MGTAYLSHSVKRKCRLWTGLVCCWLPKRTGHGDLYSTTVSALDHISDRDTQFIASHKVDGRRCAQFVVWSSRSEPFGSFQSGLRTLSRWKYGCTWNEDPGHWLSVMHTAHSSIDEVLVGLLEGKTVHWGEYADGFNMSGRLPMARGPR